MIMLLLPPLSSSLLPLVVLLPHSAPLLCDDVSEVTNEEGFFFFSLLFLFFPLLSSITGSTLCLPRVWCVHSRHECLFYHHHHHHCCFSTPNPHPTPSPETPPVLPTTRLFAAVASPWRPSPCHPGPHRRDSSVDSRHGSKQNSVDTVNISGSNLNLLRAGQTLGRLGCCAPQPLPCCDVVREKTQQSRSASLCFHCQTCNQTLNWEVPVWQAHLPHSCPLALRRILKCHSKPWRKTGEMRRIKKKKKSQSALSKPSVYVIAFPL